VASRFEGERTGSPAPAGRLLGSGSRGRPDHRRFVWGGVLANFTPGHQDTYVDFKNDDRAPLLFIAGGDDNIMPPSVNESNAHHYRRSKAITDYYEFPGRSHYTLGQDGWEEVADYALDWATKNAAAPRRSER